VVVGIGTTLAAAEAVAAKAAVVSVATASRQSSSLRGRDAVLVICFSSR